MIPSNIQSAEVLKKEIDNALLCLADTNRLEDRRFDFATNFQNLLTITGINDFMQNEISKYFSVMKDLFDFAGRVYRQIIEIKEVELKPLEKKKTADEFGVYIEDFDMELVERENVELVYKEAWELYDPKRHLIKSFSKITTDRIYPSKLKENKEFYDRQLQPQGVYTTITKYRRLLNGTDENKYQIDNLFGDAHRQDEILKLFTGRGYIDDNEVIPFFTFEKYVETITTVEYNNDNQLLDDDYNKRFSSAGAALIFLKETGIYDALLLKYKTKAKVAKVMSSITNIRWDVLERLLSKLDFNQFNDKKNNPYSIKSISEVIELLNNIDIDSTNLHHIKNIISKD